MELLSATSKVALSKDFSFAWDNKFSSINLPKPWDWKSGWTASNVMWASSKIAQKQPIPITWFCFWLSSIVRINKQLLGLLISLL